jgi:hypothetical protein
MPTAPIDDTPPDHGDYFEMDFRSAEFPSDALSVKRLRKIFPENFDTPGVVMDGYANNDFFFPTAAEKPEHLHRLTNLICAERTVASAAFYACYARENEGDHSDQFNDDEHLAIDVAEEKLEREYQYFKLADSPETARLLIRQVEEAGERDARRQAQAKGR